MIDLRNVNRMVLSSEFVQMVRKKPEEIAGQDWLYHRKRTERNCTCIEQVFSEARI